MIWYLLVLINFQKTISYALYLEWLYQFWPRIYPH